MCCSFCLVGVRAERIRSLFPAYDIMLGAWSFEFTIVGWEEVSFSYNGKDHTIFIFTRALGVKVREGERCFTGGCKI